MNEWKMDWRLMLSFVFLCDKFWFSLHIVLQKRREREREEKEKEKEDQKSVKTSGSNSVERTFFKAASASWERINSFEER